MSFFANKIDNDNFGTGASMNAQIKTTDRDSAHA